MPIVVRRTSEARTGTSPSAVILPADRVSTPGEPLPEWSLAAEAPGLLGRIGDSGEWPARWSDPAFVREVSLVLAHLAPIRSRAGLAASFSREAFHVAPRSDDPAEPPGAVRLAYALRWLELGRSGAQPA